MNLTPVIDTLKTEMQKMQQALSALESLNGPRRGRPPAWLKKPIAVQPETTNGRKPFSVATRKKMARAQNLRWAQARRVA